MNENVSSLADAAFNRFAAEVAAASPARRAVIASELRTELADASLAPKARETASSKLAHLALLNARLNALSPGT